MVLGLLLCSVPALCLAGAPEVEKRAAANHGEEPKPAVLEVQQGTGDVLWLAAAPGCPGAAGLTYPTIQVWVSRDNGNRWIPLNIVADNIEQALERPVRKLILDSKRAGRALVWSQICDDPHGKFGGSVYITEDGGWTWKALKLPQKWRDWVLDEPVWVGHQVEDLRIIGGDFNKLEVKRLGKGWWLTNDFGKTWKTIAKPTKGKKPGKLSATLKKDGCAFTASARGLHRECKGAKKELSWPTKQSFATAGHHLLWAAGKVKAATLVKADAKSKQLLGALVPGKVPAKTVATFKPDEVARVNKILGRLKFDPEADFAPELPRWEEAILLETSDGAIVPVYLLKGKLRTTVARSLDGDFHDFNTTWWENTTELTLSEADAAWFQKVLTGHLGKRKERVYVEPELPMPPEDEEEEEY